MRSNTVRTQGIMTGGSPREADYHMSWAQVRVITAQSCIRKGDADITNLRVKEKRERMNGDPTPGCYHSFTETGLFPRRPAHLQSPWPSAAWVQLLHSLSVLLKSLVLCYVSSPHVHVPPGT